jgi:general secretion pathway protein G
MAVTAPILTINPRYLWRTHSCVQRSRSCERDMCKTRRRSRRSGFTFVEMMVVITIIVILVTMAIPIYQRSIQRAKESVLASNLNTLRTVIDNYTYDKEKAPQSLPDLVTDGYLRKIPMDPITNTDHWNTVMEDATQAINQSEPGIFDIHSTSDKIGLDGRPYSDW